MRFLSLLLLLGTASAVHGMVLLTYDKSYERGDEVCFWTRGVWFLCGPSSCGNGYFERRSSGYYPEVDDDISTVRNGWSQLWHFRTDYGSTCLILGKKFCCRPLSDAPIGDDTVKVHFRIFPAANGTAKTKPAHLPMWAREHNLRVVVEEFPAPLDETGKHNYVVLN